MRDQNDEMNMESGMFCRSIFILDFRLIMKKKTFTLSRNHPFTLDSKFAL